MRTKCVSAFQTNCRLGWKHWLMTSAFMAIRAPCGTTCKCRPCQYMELWLRSMFSQVSSVRIVAVHANIVDCLHFRLLSEGNRRNSWSEMADNSNLPKKRLHTAERAFFVQRESQNWFLMYMLLRLTLITHCPSQRGGQRSSAVSELHKIWGNGLLVFLWSTCKMQVVTSKFQRFHWVNGKASLPVCVFILCNRCQRMLLKEISYKSTSQRFNWVNGKASLPACLYLG